MEYTANHKTPPLLSTIIVLSTVSPYLKTYELTMSSQSAVTSAGNRGVLHDMAINRLLSPSTSSDMVDLSSKVRNAKTANGAMHDWLSTTSAPGSKRPHTAMNDALDRTDPDSIILPGEEEGDITYDINCDQIRRKIRALIDSGEVKVTHWQRDLGINSNSYGRFMKLKGPWSGMDNQTYQAGYLYFKKRELAGIKPPNVNKKRKSGDGATPKGPPDTTDIELPGEEDDKVQVFDSCDEIRRKISAHLKKDAVTQASFLRELAAQFRTSDKKLQSKQLNDFRTKKGADHGNTSAIFYSAYV